MPSPTRVYECDKRNSALDPDLIVSALESEYPTLSIFKIEDHFANPSVTVGRVWCTVRDVSGILHGEIMAAVPGIKHIDSYPA